VGRANRAKVDEMSGETIGYLYLPDMDERLIAFARDWYPQYRKKAIIIDDRYNGALRRRHDHRRSRAQLCR